MLSIKVNQKTGQPFAERTTRKGWTFRVRPNYNAGAVLDVDNQTITVKSEETRAQWIAAGASPSQVKVG